MKIFILLIGILSLSIFADPPPKSDTEQIPHYSQIDAISNVNVANREDAWAIKVNPAGLGSVEGVNFSAGYIHAWAPTGNYHQAQGALAFSLFDPLAFGAGFEFVMPSEGEKIGTSGLLHGIFATAFKIDSFFYAGLSGTITRDLSQKENLPFALALGIQFKPFDWFSMGATMHHRQKQFFDPYTFNAGVSILPYKDYVELSVNSEFEPKSDKWSDGYTYNPGLMLAINVDIFTIKAHAEIKDIESGFDKLYFGLNLAFLFDNAGFDAIGRVDTKGYTTAGGHFTLKSSKQEEKS